MDDIKAMLGKYPPPVFYWLAVWKYLTPISVFVSEKKNIFLIEKKKKRKFPNSKKILSPNRQF